MSEIVVTQKEERNKEWRFSVKLGESEYVVIVDRDHWKKITSGKISPEKLVHASFAFLLDREPAERIIPSFNLKVISSYFPEYDEKIVFYFTLR